ncbi:amidase domain-containing protein [Streptomyces sparsogenes]|uniref:amidase domain-containing protein n=1 Tax=Streptomyces sparsogenes TaxID=67365 RepID=UPI0033D01FF6
MPRSRSKRRALAALTAALTAVALSSMSPALAYSGSGAAAYADKYALSPNTPAYPVFGADCTNFVSQAVHVGGGYPFRGAYTNESSEKVWWSRGSGPTKDTFSWSASWVGAYEFYRFLLADQPGGHPKGTAPGSSTDYWTPDSVVTGDVLFYDWGQGEGVSHAAMQVGYGADANKPEWKGNYVDYHTTNRYHAFWSLKPYNAAWATTTIYFMNIDPANK